MSIVICKCFQFGQVNNFDLGKENFITRTNWHETNELVTIHYMQRGQSVQVIVQNQSTVQD